MTIKRVLWCCGLMATIAGGSRLVLHGGVLPGPISKLWSQAAAKPSHEPPARENSANELWSRAGWQTGVVYARALDYTASFGEISDKPAAEPSFAFRVRGRLTERVLGRDGENTRVELRLIDPRVDVTGLTPQTDAVAEFAAPIYVDYDAHGRALCLHVPAHIDVTVLGILREIVSAAQVSLPDARTSTWQAAESDADGEYTSDYRLAGGTRVLRSRSGYLRVAGPHGLSAADKNAPALTSYAAMITLDDEGRLRELEFLKKVNKVLFDQEHGVESTTAIRLQQGQRSRDASNLVPSLKDYLTKSIPLDPSDYGDAGDIDRDLVAGADLNELLRMLTDDPENLASVRTRLAALFRLDPSAIVRARARLTPENAAAVLAAFATAGTPEAQRALCSVLGDPRVGQVERGSAIDAVMTLTHPTPDTGRALAPLLKSNDPEIKGNASLALGIVAGHLGEESPAAAHALVEQLTQDYSTNRAPEDRVRVIGALGNTRSADSLPTLTQSMQSDDAGIRAASAAALRFVPGTAADGMLSNAISSDASSSVRGSALMAAGYRDYAPLAPALEGVAHGNDASLRGQLVSTLSNMAPHDAQAFELLDWIAQHDPDEKVRSRAQAALAHSPS
jgi:lipoprotein